jgi:hypothetical protein
MEMGVPTARHRPAIASRTWTAMGASDTATNAKMVHSAAGKEAGPLAAHPQDPLPGLAAIRVMIVDTPLSRRAATV